ncbi:DUF6777 domain-containing protein [Streptomyces sp. NPDC002889]|uniref:DUF6777 domain-containing protein n=1 Tax=Streptomyces sp. NPDC002889 TaxID=3364669 RepID=UPI0036757FA2
MRRVCAAVAALSVGLLTSGCEGERRPAESAEVFLQPVAAPGPNPYTASTATSASLPPLPPVSDAPTNPAGGGQTLRTLSGSAPGLYGGTQKSGSCDIEKQVRFLEADRAKAGAFAKGAGIDQSVMPAFLRGLTPVVLRADTRITNHGLRGGSAVRYQAVLQAGTAVLVDQYGAPRVRCASGTPLKPPVPAKSSVVVKGAPWKGYRSDRVLVIKPATQVVNSLMIVNSADSSWIERPVGTDGEQDAPPQVFPPVDPDAVFSDPASRRPDGYDVSAAPSDPGVPADPAVPAPVDPAVPAPVDPQPALPADPPAPPADPQPVLPVDPPQPQDELEPVDPLLPGEEEPIPVDPEPLLSQAPAEPDTFQG